MSNDIDIKDIIPKNVFGANSVLLYCCIRIATLFNITGLHVAYL